MRTRTVITVGVLGLILAPSTSAQQTTHTAPHLYIPSLKVFVKLGTCSSPCSFSKSQQILGKEVMWWPSTKDRPSSGGVYAVAGHDVTSVPGFRPHGPFHYLYKMRRGQSIFIFWRGLIYKYRVTLVTTKSAAGSLLGKAPGERLVLSTCWPPYSAVKRMLVYTKLVN